MIQSDVLKNCDSQSFLMKSPFPWLSLDEFLDDKMFKDLETTYPDIKYFEKHEGIDRSYGQRPHNRYYLAYENSVYKDFKIDRTSNPGVIHHEQLSNSWQQFIDYLSSKEYYKLISGLMDVKDFSIRFAWHMQTTSWDVCPHLDSPKKLGTHLFYFNSERDWVPEWGGGTAILAKKDGEELNPPFSSFGEIIEAPCLGNKSFIFKNTKDAWHGVLPLKCPPGKYRRLFAVVFNYSQKRTLFSYIKAPLKKIASTLVQVP